MVIATGRNVDALKSVAALGADVTIELVANDPTMESAFEEQFAGGVDVVIDYLWGRSAERILIAAARAGSASTPIRFVQVGSASGSDISLPSAVLRSSTIMMMGSGIGSVPLEGLVRSIDGLLGAAAPAGFKIAVRTVPLSEVAQAWPTDDTARRTRVYPGCPEILICAGPSGCRGRCNPIGVS